MKIKDEAFVDECKETLKLLALYGDESLPHYDPRVTEMVKRKVDEKDKVQTRREFLQLLREIDQKHKSSPTPEEHPRNSSEESEAEVSATPDKGVVSKGMLID